MNLLLIVAVLSLNFALQDARISESLKVTLPDGGELIGRYLSSHSGRGIRAFMGVPYAEPPVGSLRFSSPIPKSPWRGSRDAVQESKGCLSFDYLFHGNVSVGSEDCLYLNVYAPQRPKTTDPLPVMVFFHGGGFSSGNGGKTLYGPDYLLDHDVIFVSGNYRLGIFGFLSTNTLDCPGNFGLKDQVEILKWVKKNIGVFGGDKNSVTIFGESAGGASVTYQTVSPLSQGLFHRGISQSGTHLGIWALQNGEIAARNARKLADAIKCPADEKDVREMIKCLRNISSKEIISHFYDFFKWSIFPIIYWAPVIEPRSEYAFLDQDPLNISKGNDIPLMIGITSMEGAIVSVAILRDSNLIDDIHSESNSLLPDILSYQDYSEVAKNNVTSMISEFYFGNHEVNLRDSEMFQKFTDLLSDGFFLNAVDTLLQHRLQDSLSSNTFLYLFNHKGDSSFSELFLNNPESEYGVSHMDDLIYLFPVLKENYFRGIPTEVDDYIRNTLVSMWTNFAKFGNPTINSNKTSLVEWKVAGLHPYDYLRIGKYNQIDVPIVAMEKGFYEERASLWKKIRSVLADSEIVVN